MCILFLYINNEAGNENATLASNNNDDGKNTCSYKLILANNRDEIYDRPALAAEHWRDAKHCYGGLDYQPGRQGGTWIAASTRGRLASTLNVMSRLDPIKAGRGHLIPDYLNSPLSTEDYIETIALNGGQYNSFNFVALENKNNHWSCQMYTNVDGGSKQTFDNGIYQFGNSLHYDKPWRKGEYGRAAFTNILGSVGQSDTSTIHADLLNLLSDEYKNYPDEVLESQSSHYPSGSAEKFSSICVDLRPHARYGTRTKTIITVDGNNNCRYMEHTMVEPIPIDNIKWKSSVKEFKIDSY